VKTDVQLKVVFFVCFRPTTWYFQQTNAARDWSSTYCT